MAKMHSPRLYVGKRSKLKRSSVAVESHVGDLCSCCVDSVTWLRDRKL